MLHGKAKAPKAKKVLGKGPMKVGNKGSKAMGTTIGKSGGMNAKPRGSDSSKVKGKTFNARKYEAVRRSVFGFGRTK